MTKVLSEILMSLNINVGWLLSKDALYFEKQGSKF